MKERILTPEAQADRDDFEESTRGCACHLGCAPCSHCSHPGNPHNQEDDSCWQEVGPELVEVKTSDLIGTALDYAVAVATGYYMQADLRHLPPVTHDTRDPELWRPSENWAHGGPLIDQHNPSLSHQKLNSTDGEPYCAAVGTGEMIHFHLGATYLIAVCRAIVASRLGDTVQVPKELMP